MESDLTSFLRQIPKTDLHCHYSSIVPYKTIITKIQQLGLGNRLCFQVVNNGQTTRQELYFDESDKIPQSHCTQEQLDQILQTINGVIQQERITIVGYVWIGDIFYEIIRSKLFYNRYVDLIMNHFEQSNIVHAEIRIKFDDVTKQIFNYIQQMKYNNLKFIIQLNKGVIIVAKRNDPKHAKAIIIELLDDKDFMQYCKSGIVIGLDFVGGEVEMNYQILKDQEIVQRMKQLNIKYYLHAGETLDIKNKYAERNIITAMNLFQKGIGSNRIGHGIQAVLQERELKDINLELCPYSNIKFVGGTLGGKEILRVQNNIIICSDDENKFNKSLIDNYLYVVEQVNKELSVVQIRELIMRLVMNGFKNSNMQSDQCDRWIKEIEAYKI